MSLSRLEISNFRNLKSTKIHPSPGFNLFYGENGSGKTSILEAIYHLGFGRSFRTHNLDRLIHRDFEKFSLFGEVSSIPIGIERCRKGQSCMRVRQKSVDSIAELVEVFPLQFINHDVYRLVNSGPKERRRFIDLGVFHAEHQRFLSLWKQWRRVLKQRNFALKMRPADKKRIELWNVDFVATACEIDLLRRQYLSQFELILLEIVKRFLHIDQLKILFYSGWNEKVSLQQVLDESLPSDVERGYTQFGPHHADLRIYLDKMPVSDVLSRGQLKLFVCAMRLAQAILLKEQAQKQGVLLIDDLASELDGARKQVICEFLSELKTQVFLTSAHSGIFDGLFDKNLTKIFYVQNGIVTK
jgi:DNA replication and repair protein RecF